MSTLLTLLALVGAPALAQSPDHDPCADVTLGFSHNDQDGPRLFDGQALDALSDAERGAYDLYKVGDPEVNEALSIVFDWEELDLLNRLKCLPLGEYTVFAEGQNLVLGAEELYGNLYLVDPGAMQFESLPRVMEGVITVERDGETITIDPGPSIVTDDGDPAVDLMVKVESTGAWTDPEPESLALAEGTPVVVEVDDGGQFEVGVINR